MTIDNNVHDIDESFVWNDKYRAELEVFAERDEVNDDLHWPPLKEAIKYLLKQTFDKWPTSSSPILHPAAALLPPRSAFADEASTSINGGLHADDSEDDLDKVTFDSDGGSTSASPNTATAALALSSRFQREGDGMRSDESEIPAADLQAFFPSSRQAPAEWGGSWGRRLQGKAEVDRERQLIFSMLDDFEGQPPFTIQRLSELVLRPSEHHHTLPKYVSALKRLLSVTATRDAFPAYGEDLEPYSAAIVTTEAMNGHGTPITGSRTGTGTPVPGSPATAPLFSPIPFLMKSGDEGMPGKGSDGGINDEDVPGMELGGADRTTEDAVELARRTGAGAGSGVAAGRSSMEMNGDSSGEDKPVPVIRPAPEPTPLMSNSMDVNNTNVTDAGNGVSSSQPLGVPTGRVDELDQLGNKHGQLPPLESGSLGGGAKALSSTTTATVSDGDKSREALEKEEEDLDGSSARAVKRVRSERDLTFSTQGEVEK